MMRWMHDIYPDMGYDCASEREMSDVLPIVSAAKIIYAQPCKKKEDIKVAQARGVSLTVVDSVEEIETLADAGWTGGVLIRLLVRDSDSKQPFGRKFGAPREWLPRMYDVARATKLSMRGFSFHVGSECMAPQQYVHAIRDCVAASAVANAHGFSTTTMNVGGGFLPDEESFAAVAKHINVARHVHFPDPAVHWIAEPGRFLAAPTHTLFTTVIGKKPVWPEPTSHAEPAWRVTIDESVYGSFSNIPFDHQKPVLERVRSPIHSGETKRPTIVFGRTCDSSDCIGTVPLHDVNIGDVLKVEHMGAYTTVTASEFNGFPKAARVYEF